VLGDEQCKVARICDPDQAELHKTSCDRESASLDMFCTDMG